MVSQRGVSGRLAMSRCTSTRVKSSGMTVEVWPAAGLVPSVVAMWRPAAIAWCPMWRAGASDSPSSPVVLSAAAVALSANASAPSSTGALPLPIQPPRALSSVSVAGAAGGADAEMLPGWEPLPDDVYMSFSLLGNSTRLYEELANETLETGGRYPWGSQWFNVLNANRTASCGLGKTPLPMVESQSTILSSAFLEWYEPTLRYISAFQAAGGTDWGHDSSWCAGAYRYIAAVHGATGTAAYTPCALFELVSVSHEDERTIAQSSVDFWCGSHWLVQKLAEGLDDFRQWGLVNAWLEEPGRCDTLSAGGFDAVGSYATYVAANGTRTGLEYSAKL
mmetsp:Transcript_14143/g.37336  ORF Transcript_14143/g.37336 Transcript_14143/m.37336 type:complete len:335 (+) Transcript_14143:606-1610(+)